MSPVTRGFHRKRQEVDASRVPPGPYVTRDFPLLAEVDYDAPYVLAFCDGG